METAIEGDQDFTATNQGWNYISGDATNWELHTNDSPLRLTYAGPIYDLSRSAHRRRPLVTGFSLPFPCRYQAEGMMMIPAYSALQGWDALLWDVYDDGSLGSDRFIDTAKFNVIATNPVMTSMMPLLSQLYRNRLLAPAVNTISVQHSVEQARILPRLESSWGSFAVPGGFDGRVMATSRVVIDSTSASSFTQYDDISFPAQVDGQMQSDTREILWEYNRGSLLLDAPRVQGASGALVRAGGVNLRNLDITLLSGNETATLLWVPLDSAAHLDAAGRSVIAMTTRTEPTGWHWQDSVHADRWGAAPMVIDPMKVRLAFHPADSITVVTLTPLDASGRPQGEPIRGVRGGGAITLQVDQAQTHAVWYSVDLVADPAAGVDDPALPAPALAVYPSIVSDRAYVAVSSGAPAHDALLELYDQLGRRVAVLHAGPLAGGTERIRLDAAGLPQGAYLLRLRTERGEIGTTRVTVMR
jgi:hypothetical protein